MKRSLNTVVMLLLLAATAPLRAQSIQQLAADGHWQQAEQQLTVQYQNCQQQGEVHCQLTYLFTRAWLDTEIAMAVSGDDDTRMALLEQAKQGYQQVLTMRPGHAATTDNLLLVLIESGDVDGLIALYPDLEPPAKQQEVAELIAQLSQQQDNSTQAFAYFARAFASGRELRNLDNMIDLFNNQPDQKKAAQMMKQAGAIRDNQPLFAASLFAAVANHRKSVELPTWNAAALGWTETLSLNRQLTPDIIEATFDLAASRVFSALHRRLTAPYLGANQDNTRLYQSIMFPGQENGGWWTANARRAHTLATAGWSMGHYHLLNKDPQSADKAWRAALYYAPNSENYRYELADYRAISLELLTDLARIQQLYKKQLDQDGQNFAAIERLLFQSKSRAYEVNDLAAIQRHHTVLGRMYADLGIFERGVRGAKFQLTHAIKASERRAAQNKASDPQPVLASLLASGYNCQLPQQSNCSTDQKLAREWYSKATMGFLELDAIQRAEQSFSRVVELQPNQFSPQERQLQIILNTRKAAMNNPVPLDTTWLQEGADALPRDFVLHQQFKVLADSGIQGDKQSAEQARNLMSKQPRTLQVTDSKRVQQLKQKQL